MISLPIGKIAFAILSGLLLTASFAPSPLDWLVWFALVPLLRTLHDESPLHAFLLGFIAGLAHFLTLIYWIVPTLQNYGFLNFLTSSGALVLLCLYLALYPALFSYLLCRLQESRFPVFTMASLWVGLEVIRAHFLTGFPWCLLGYTQFRNLFLIQVADLVGVYGVSFMIILSNGLIYRLFFRRDALGRRDLKWEGMGLLLVAVFSLIYGQYRLAGDLNQGKGGKSLKAAIIQGNIDQTIKWNPAYQEKTVDTYHRLTRSTSLFKPDLVVWPETAVPFFFQDNEKLSPRLFEMSREARADLIFGSPAYKRTGSGTKYYNRVYLLSPKGELAGYYDKVHLVPFGEYVPYRWLFPFFRHLLHAAGNFASGEKIEPLKLTNYSAGTLICFEVIFPELARTQARKGAEILVNLTNDAWFGKTSAPYQHLSMAVFRAVENGRPLLRAANTGFSAFIGPQGHIMTRSQLFKEEVLTQDLRLRNTSLRFYTRYGDLFALALLVVSFLKVFHLLCYNKILSVLSRRS
ncbi:MAG: apolipoprotein N-acyltransferase [Desulfobacteraceae bacterium]|nr:apolipoprotein N-acyltransferase [Desulfobacteraceae bacterium]